MNILIVGLVKNEQLERLRTEAEKRGHKIRGCYASELVIHANNNLFEPTLRGESMEDYDLIYLWAVGKRRWDWYTAMLYLNKKYKTVIINQKILDPEYNYYLTPAIDFFKQVEEGLPFPETSIIFSPKSLNIIKDKYKFPIIVKISGGRQGKGVFKADNNEELEKIVNELFVDQPSVIIREFIPNDGDIRIFTVGYEAIGAMKRTPTKEGEFRSNISQGGVGAEFDLENSPEIRKIAEHVSKVMQTEIAGVDIIINKETNKPYILEVNPGPQFTGLEKFTSTNAALEIVKYFESVYSP